MSTSVLSIGAGVVHLAAFGSHHGLLAILIAVTGIAQVGAGVLLLIVPGRWAVALCAVVNAGAVLAWIASRTVGLPVPGGAAEPVGAQDLICALLGAGAFLGALFTLAYPDRRWPNGGWVLAAFGGALAIVGVLVPSHHGILDQSVPILEAGRISSRLPEAEAIALLGLSARPVLQGAGGHSHTGAGHGNGFQEPPPADPLDPADQELFDAQWAAAIDAAASLATPEQAEAAGYRQASTDAPGIGAHWVKWSLVDKPFDPAHPSMLLFRARQYGQPPELVGFSYWVASAGEPEGFSGSNDHWHAHQGMCFVDGWLRYERVERRQDCEDTWIEASDLWMLHAWPVPGAPNRWGLFADMNPALCSASRQTPDINRCDPDTL
jgi:hypothetical protein